MRLSSVLIVALLTVSGCGTSSSSSSSTPAQGASAPSAAPRPHIRFVSPRDGQRVGGSFTARVVLANFTIDPHAVGMAPRPGRGHLHFKLDGGRYDYPKFSGPNGVAAMQLGVTGKYSPALAPTITYSHIPPGRHTLEVLIANNNHTSVGVGTVADLTVEGR